MGDGRWEMGDGRWEMGDGREWGREGGKGVKIPSTRATGAYWARRMSIRWQSILMSTLSFSPSFKFAMKVDNSIQLIKNTFTSLLPSSPISSLLSLDTNAIQACIEEGVHALICCLADFESVVHLVLERSQINFSD